MYVCVCVYVCVCLLCAYVWKHCIGRNFYPIATKFGRSSRNTGQFQRCMGRIGTPRDIPKNSNIFSTTGLIFNFKVSLDRAHEYLKLCFRG